MKEFQVLREPVPGASTQPFLKQGVCAVLTCFKELAAALLEVCVETGAALQEEFQSIREELRREFTDLFHR